MSDLRLDNITLVYERKAGFGRVDRNEVLRDLNLTISPGEFVVLLGRSGSGKTSILNLAAGFLSPTSGQVLLDGEPVTGPAADRAVVFQDDALFVWLTARDNVALPLKLRRVGLAERTARANELLARVDLADYGDRFTWELSGGQRQRVGIARALAAEPRFLLMDEPLGALDAMTRDRMQELLLRAWSTSNTGALLITHSVEEALFLATRVVVLTPGGRVVSDRQVEFSRRFLAGEPARPLRAEPHFIALRETLIAEIGEDERTAA